MDNNNVFHVKKVHFHHILVRLNVINVHKGNIKKKPDNLNVNYVLSECIIIFLAIVYVINANKENLQIEKANHIVRNVIGKYNSNILEKFPNF